MIYAFYSAMGKFSLELILEDSSMQRWKMCALPLH